jgi:hypothetical protein
LRFGMGSLGIFAIAVCIRTRSLKYHAKLSLNLKLNNFLSFERNAACPPLTATVRIVGRSSVLAGSCDRALYATPAAVAFAKSRV